MMTLNMERNLFRSTLASAATSIPISALIWIRFPEDFGIAIGLLIGLAILLPIVHLLSFFGSSNNHRRREAWDDKEWIEYMWITAFGWPALIGFLLHIAV